MIKLPYVHSPRDRHGKQRHYFRKPGVKRVPLPGLPGSAEFNRAYEAALAGETTPRVEVGVSRSKPGRVEVGVSRSKPGSVAAAVATYYQSISFGSLGPATKQVRRRIGHLLTRPVGRPSNEVRRSYAIFTYQAYE